MGILVIFSYFMVGHDSTRPLLSLSLVVVMMERKSYSSRGGGKVWLARALARVRSNFFGILGVSLRQN
jgi:hypothetical protein